MCESHLDVVSTSSIIFLKEPSVNPFVGDPLQHALLCTVSPLQALALKFIHTHTKLWGVNSAKIYKYYIDNILCHHRYYDAIG